MQHRNVLTWWYNQKPFHVDLETGELLSHFVYLWSGFAVRLNDALLPFAEALCFESRSYRGKCYGDSDRF